MGRQCEASTEEMLNIFDDEHFPELPVPPQEQSITEIVQDNKNNNNKNDEVTVPEKVNVEESTIGKENEDKTQDDITFEINEPREEATELSIPEEASSV